MEIGTAVRLFMKAALAWGVTLAFYVAVLGFPWWAVEVWPPGWALLLGSVLALVWGVGLASRRPPVWISRSMLFGLGVDLIVFLVKHPPA